MDSESMYYNDADDRPLAEWMADDELPVLEGVMLINEDIVVPLFVVNGVAYY